MFIIWFHSSLLFPFIKSLCIYSMGLLLLIRILWSDNGISGFPHKGLLKNWTGSLVHVASILFFLFYHLRVVENHQRTLGQMLGQVVENILAHLTPVVHQQLRVVALSHREFRNPFLRQRVVIIAYLYLLCFHTGRKGTKNPAICQIIPMQNYSFMTSKDNQMNDKSSTKMCEHHGAVLLCNYTLGFLCVLNLPCSLHIRNTIVHVVIYIPKINAHL